MAYRFKHWYVFSAGPDKYPNLEKLYRAVCDLLPTVKNKGSVHYSHDCLITDKPLTFGNIKKLEEALGIEFKGFMELGRG